LDTQSYDMFAVDIAHDARLTNFVYTVGMLMNNVLAPFRGDKEDEYEFVKDLNHRWTKDSSPHVINPYNMA